MAEGKRRKGRTIARANEVVGRARDTDDAERSLGGWVAVGLPALCAAGAIVAGAVATVGSALLVLASGALLGTIALLWASLRTLSGDAPLPRGVDSLAAARATSELAEEKRRVLRALKDLESERAIGKIDGADYRALVARYRDEAKSLMREMDLEISPFRAKAESLAREHLEREGLTATAEALPPGEVSGPADGRLACGACDASNEPDAVFCKQCGVGMGTAKEKRDATA